MTTTDDRPTEINLTRTGRNQVTCEHCPRWKSAEYDYLLDACAVQSRHEYLVHGMEWR